MVRGGAELREFGPERLDHLLHGCDLIEGAADHQEVSVLHALHGLGEVKYLPVHFGVPEDTLLLLLRVEMEKAAIGGGDHAAELRLLLLREDIGEIKGCHHDGPADPRKCPRRVQDGVAAHAVPTEEDAVWIGTIALRAFARRILRKGDGIRDAAGDRIAAL